MLVLLATLSYGADWQIAPEAKLELDHTDAGAEVGLTTQNSKVQSKSIAGGGIRVSSNTVLVRVKGFVPLPGKDGEYGGSWQGILNSKSVSAELGWAFSPNEARFRMVVLGGASYATNTHDYSLDNGATSTSVRNGDTSAQLEVLAFNRFGKGKFTFDVVPQLTYSRGVEWKDAAETLVISQEGGLTTGTRIRLAEPSKNAEQQLRWGVPILHAGDGIFGGKLNLGFAPTGVVDLGEGELSRLDTWLFLIPNAPDFKNYRMGVGLRVDKPMSESPSTSVVFQVRTGALAYEL